MNNFKIQSYTILQKDGIQECGILCAIKESCGGFIYIEESGNYSLPMIKKENFFVQLFYQMTLIIKM